jgi:hypothetical protein
MPPTATQADLLRRLESYVDESCGVDQWGDEQTLAIAAWVVGQRIVVLQPVAAPLIYQPEAARTVGSEECVILYNGINHYNSTADVSGIQDESDRSDVDELDDAGGDSAYHDSDDGSEADHDAIGFDSEPDNEPECGACYVEIEHLEMPEESIDEAMEQCMESTPVVMDPHASTAVQAKRELAAAYIAEEFLREHPTLPPNPQGPHLPWGCASEGVGVQGSGSEDSATEDNAEEVQEEVTSSALPHHREVKTEVKQKVKTLIS